MKNLDFYINEANKDIIGLMKNALKEELNLK